MDFHFWPIGGAVTKLMWCGQNEVSVTHINVGVNMSRHCRDKAW